MYVAAASRSLVQVHLAHVLGAAAFIVVALVAAAVADARDKNRRGHVGRRQLRVAPVGWASRTSGLAAVGAAAIHFRVMPEHFGEAFIYGLFFAVVASTQLLWGVVAIVRPYRVALIAGAAGNAAVILLWLVTRTIAIPLGPDAGSTEQFGGLDVLASVCEAVLVVAAVVALRRGERRPGAERSAPQRMVRV